MMKMRQSQGFSMIELLVAVLVVGIGVLGATGLQMISLQHNRGAVLRSEAVQLAYDIMDRIRANPNGNYSGLNLTSPPPAAPNCLGGVCTEAQMAAFDQASWKCSLGNFQYRCRVHRIARRGGAGTDRQPTGPAERRRFDRCRRRDRTGRRDGELAGTEHVEPDDDFVREPTMSAIRTPQSAGGFSIIELMIALTLGTIVIFGIVQLFTANDRTYSLLNAQSRLQESGRFAFDFIKEQTRSSGFYGCGPERQNVVKQLRGTWPMLYEFDVTTPVVGYDGKADGSWSPSLVRVAAYRRRPLDEHLRSRHGCQHNGDSTRTDVLVVRRVRAPEAPLRQVLQPLGNPVVAAPGGNSGFATGDVVVVADCQRLRCSALPAKWWQPTRATVLHGTSALGDPYENATVIDSPTGPIPSTLSFLGRSLC